MAADFPVELEHVRMAFGSRVVFRDLSCRFPRGKISVILGGSGSGKSTILRLVGGLVRPQAGRILVDGEDVTRLAERRLYAVRRKLGMMFQGGALLDSLTVFDNCAFPLREHSGLDEPAIADKVRQRLQQVGLAGAEGLLPGELSGGMLKRAALARALMEEPEVVLCDEPFSGLDPVSVKMIEALLQEINHTHGVTMVVVSHHIASTLRMADQVVLLFPERVVTGAPAELRRSRDPQIVAFLDEHLDGAEAAAAR